MNKLRISKRYNNLYKVCVQKFTSLEVWEDCCCHVDGKNLLFRTDYSARVVGVMLLADVANSFLTHDIYISGEIVARCSESTALEIVSMWIKQDLFVGEISVNHPMGISSSSYMNRVYRGSM